MFIPCFNTIDAQHFFCNSHSAYSHSVFPCIVVLCPLCRIQITYLCTDSLFTFQSLHTVSKPDLFRANAKPNISYCCCCFTLQAFNWLFIMKKPKCVFVLRLAPTATSHFFGIYFQQIILKYWMSNGTARSC